MAAAPVSLFAPDGFSILTAAALSRACQATYDHSGDSMAAFLQAVNVPAGSSLAPSGGMQGWVRYFLAPPNTLVVVFEGLSNLRQALAAHFLSALDSMATTFPTSAGGINRLALNTYLARRSSLASVVAGAVFAAGGDINLLLGGHSYGGLMAHIMAIDYTINSTVSGHKVKVVGSYSFGSPKFLDQAGAAWFGANVLNGHAFSMAFDPIPYTPTSNLVTLGEAVLTGGGLGSVQRYQRDYTSIPHCYSLAGTGTVWEVPPFGELTDEETLGALRYVLTTGMLPREHRIEAYYHELSSYWQAAVRGQRAAQPTRQVRDAIDSIPMPAQPAAADISAGSMPALSSYFAIPTAPSGGSSNASRQVVRVRGLPLRAQSEVASRRHNWSRGNGRAHRQILKVLQLMDSLLRHDGGAAAGTRPGTRTITNEALWSAAQQQAFYDTYDLFQFVASGRF